MDLPLIDNYQELFLNDTPMIDLRAPVEFAQGAFPSAQSLPLMSDEERKLVGTCYKEQGQEAAIELGHQLVSGEIKAERIAGWANFFEQNPDGVLYCFRGGLRSRITQRWIFEETGIAYPRVNGGYKQLRRFLIDDLAQSCAVMQPYILSGRTGTGKTLLLNSVKRSIDLEGIFHHRGSSFGRHPGPQPTQINVENQLAIELLKQRLEGDDASFKVLFEDEGGNIGSRSVPAPLLSLTEQAPVVVLEASMETRIGVVFDEYITASLAEYQQYHGEQQGFDIWAANLQLSLARVERRLGGMRYKIFSEVMDSAIAAHRNGETSGHCQWIELLLGEYYDPMYDYQLSKKADRILFRGNAAAIADYLLEQGVS